MKCDILNPSHSSYLPAYEDGTECFEMLEYKIQTPGNYPEKKQTTFSSLPQSACPLNDEVVSPV